MRAASTELDERASKNRYASVPRDADWTIAQNYGRRGLAGAARSRRRRPREASPSSSP